MATQYITETLTLNVVPTTLFTATDTTSYILAKFLLKNERDETGKITIKLNDREVVKDLVLPIFNQKPIELDSISKLKLSSNDTLEITVIPDSLAGGSVFGLIGGFPWYTQVEANAATMIMSYVMITTN